MKLARSACAWLRSALPLGVFALSLVAGCSSSSRLKKDDPLFGEFTPKGNGPPASSASKAKAAVPPLPEATTSSSTAAMAAGDPLAGSRPLGISEGSAGGWHGLTGKSATAEGAFAGYPAASPAGSLTGGTAQTPTVVPLLRRPEPIVELTPPHATVAHSGPPQAGSIPMTPVGDYRRLQSELQARRVSWQRVESHGEGFKFTCAVPNRANPDYHRVYEAIARDTESAIQAVLAQIDAAR